MDFEWPKIVTELHDRCWKPEGSRLYDLWKPEPLRKFFQEHGYILWLSMYEEGWGDKHNVELLTPNDEPRRPDGYTFVSRYQCQPGIVIYKNFTHLNNIHYPARTIHNQDVLIRLISIGGDATGDEHYEAIRRLSTGQTAFRRDNYALPLLNEFEFNGLRFVVFPLLTLGGYMPWFYNVDEILDYFMQIFKGVKFCHDNLIAHLDLDGDNILYNSSGGREVSDETTEYNVAGPFRSHFPIRYYINDFETATRKITGLPNVRVGRIGQYGREYAPEMLINEPYCPFKAASPKVSKSCRSWTSIDRAKPRYARPGTESPPR
ncbi:hypothetical protein ARMSODRAFT_1026368 [Armillaria solidipes]|uniref:Protein kinase domain-containing protein n=1 Tax=Armillaria solidipes TaxID=1076256 RepID=A0A2H3AP87_9AGAR|nr:hypothetical protein ARMSODRAFT_1026368 [Armillaria solidipes]